MASSGNKPAPPSRIPRKPVTRGTETQTNTKPPSAKAPDTKVGKPAAPIAVQHSIPAAVPAAAPVTAPSTTTTTATATAITPGDVKSTTTATEEAKKGKAAESVTSQTSSGGKSSSKSKNKEKRNTIDLSMPEDFQGEVQTDNTLPSPETLRKIENYTVQDADGRSHTFRSLYAGRNVARRVMIIFVRHFFCGNCQEYLRILSASITPDALLQLPVSTFIAVVGCGAPELIGPYIKETGCPFPVYTDPTRKLYAELGMLSTLRLGSRPAYMNRKSLIQVTASGVVQGLKQIRSGLATKMGDQRQVGGEFLFEPASLSLEPPIATPIDEGASSEDGHDVLADVASARSGRSKKSRRSRKSGKGLDLDLDHDDDCEFDDDADDDRVEPKRITWCHRMRTTRDHAEIPELMEVLGLIEVDEEGNELAGEGVAAGVSSGVGVAAGTGKTNAPPRLKADDKRWDKALKARKGTGKSMAARMSRMSFDVARSLSGSLGGVSGSGSGSGGGEAGVGAGVGNGIDSPPSPDDNANITNKNHDTSNRSSNRNSRNGSVANQEAVAAPAPRASMQSQSRR